MPLPLGFLVDDHIYIEWFTKFSYAYLYPDSKLYQVVPLIKDHE